MDYRIFNVRTHGNACNCTRGCMDAVRESALKVDSGRKLPCSTGESNLCQRLAGPTHYQLNYILTHLHGPKDTSVYKDINTVRMSSLCAGGISRDISNVGV